jgi:hypothetical protein
VRPDQTVCEMVVEVLSRQAEALVAESGEPFEAALTTVLQTEAGRQLTELADSQHRDEKARDWQESLIWERAKERLGHLVGPDASPHSATEHHYSWLEGYIEWLEGREARAQYYALLEEELANLRR